MRAESGLDYLTFHPVEAAWVKKKACCFHGRPCNLALMKLYFFRLDLI